ncbi:unnamed protein product [Zymoseptoria tritici ST99CH_3D1]|uniref:Uncharacterized protein n=1 Tax=Zymoseptoria tritici ST99CH_1E4 TaxID=1276532 RepID=A0A2H1G5K8_ZYMTR|nr:unnamed protein product [Zymoseptoria tritici ST99CH_1E4]SMR50025.1 unnamed protein product [Zymoseptoria tritici ST99CH_3D1]
MSPGMPNEQTPVKDEVHAEEARKTAHREEMKRMEIERDQLESRNTIYGAALSQTMAAVLKMDQAQKARDEDHDLQASEDLRSAAHVRPSPSASVEEPREMSPTEIKDYLATIASGVKKAMTSIGGNSS